MASSAQLMRAYTGPALFSFGFRPFFLFGAIWAATAMLLWLAMLTGWLDLPTAFDSISWHAHEFLFGYLGAIIAGFLLTAVPNWTGRLPIIGWRLATLFVLWVLGRVAVAFSANLSLPLVIALDLAMPVLLMLAIAREIVAGKNWRNLIVLGILATFVLANLVFHLEAADGGYAAQGYGFRIGLGAAIILIAMIGGRIVPSFTRNWLVKKGVDTLPAPPMQVVDKIALLILLGAVLLWVVYPGSAITGVMLIIAGIAHLGRLARWRGHLTFNAPIVAVLHVGYLFVPLGALAMGFDQLAGETGTAMQHVWMAGGIGLMTLAVMTRASLGHTGRAIVANAGTVVVYICIVAATLLRTLALWLSEWSQALFSLSGVFWLLAFGGFAVLYGPLLFKPRQS